MSAELFGLLSGGLVVVSIIPYSIRTYQRKVAPRLTSWALWSSIGLILLLTYRSSGAEANIWPAVFGFFNPMLIVLIIIIRQRGKLEWPNNLEIACIVISMTSLVMWVMAHENKELSQYALYMAIVADIFASIPTIDFVWRHPDEDRPFAWALFAIGYGLAFFAIPESTFANYILPAYMVTASLNIMFPLVLYRLKKNIPLKEWI